MVIEERRQEPADLDDSPDIDKPCPDGATPLLTAFHQGHAKVTQFLCRAGADIANPDKNDIYFITGEQEVVELEAELTNLAKTQAEMTNSAQQRKVAQGSAQQHKAGQRKVAQGSAKQRKAAHSSAR